ncbi:MAG TPA: hypothetical protein VLS48_07035, partial [Anaerolineales bacterium]|nr:hypothetical protein [Anaerolineales bacterium]
MRRSLLWVGLYLVGVLLAACSPVTPRVTPSPGALTATPRSSVTPRPTQAPQTPTVTPEPVSLIAVTPEALRGRTLQFWHAWDGPTGAALAEQVAAFNAVNEWGLQVELKYAGVLDELADAAAAAYPDGEPPDLAMAYAYQALGWDEGRAVTDLTPLVEDPIWGLPPADVNDFYPAAWEAGEIGGRRVGVPLYLDSQVLIYNRGWGKELGFDTPPLTKVQFERQACTAAQANARDDDPTNDGTGGYLATTHYAAILNWIYAGGAEATAANGRSYRFDSQAVQDTLDFLRGLYDRGCSHLAETQRPQDEFARRRALFFVDELSALPALEGAFRRTGRVE